MFSGLDLSPMLILLLLVYGLLIAFSLFAWSALNLRQRSRAEQEPVQQEARQQRKPDGRQYIPASQPVQRREADVRVRVRREQEDQGGQQKPWLRTPAPQPLPDSAAPRTPASVYVHPERLPVTRLSTPQPVVPEREAARETVQPAPVEQKPVVPVRTQPAPARPAPAPQETRQQDVRPVPEAPAGRTRNEDAFERFLRSSRNDPED